MKLYEATEDLATVNDWIAEHEEEIVAAGGELPPELQELLDLAEGQLADKVERVAFYIKRLEGEEQIIEEEIRRLKDRARVKGNAIDGLKNYLQRCMIAAGQPKIERPLITVSVQKSPPSVQGPNLDDPAVRETLHAWIREKVTYALDGKKVLDIYRAGGELPSSITVTSGTHLRIR